MPSFNNLIGPIIVFVLLVAATGQLRLFGYSVRAETLVISRSDWGWPSLFRGQACPELLWNGR